MLSCLSPRRPCCGPKAAASVISPAGGQRVERMGQVCGDRGGMGEQGHALAAERRAQGAVGDKPIDAESHRYTLERIGGVASRPGPDFPLAGPLRSAVRQHVDSSVDAPSRCKRIFEEDLARSRMLPSVRPLMRSVDSCWPVWEFADRSPNHKCVLEGTVDSPGFPGPVSPTVAPYPPSSAYVLDDLTAALSFTPPRPELGKSSPLAISAQTILAILLASATATSMRGFRASICSSHEPAGAPRGARLLDDRTGRR